MDKTLKRGGWSPNLKWEIETGDIFAIFAKIAMIFYESPHALGEENRILGSQAAMGSGTKNRACG